MNRLEALRVLGLDEDATPEDIKTAYKETAQILHPDRFQGNKKLQERATEQFKNLQEAYDYLTRGKGSKGTSPRGGSTRPRGRASTIEARMAGIAAARAQLVAQRDAAYDERRNGLGMAIVGGIVALVAGRRPAGLLAAVAGVAAAAAAWGVVQVVSSQRTINTLDEHIKDLKRQQRRLAEQLEAEEEEEEEEASEEDED